MLNMDSGVKPTYGDVSWIVRFNRVLSAAEIKEFTDDPWSYLQPRTNIIPFSTAAGTTAGLTGTATASIDEADIVAGSNTIILTLTGDTFVTGTTSEDGIAAGSDSDIAPSGTNWDSLIKSDLDNTDLVLSVGDTVATITLPPYASYDNIVQETITWTIPAASLTISSIDVTATPTFTVDTAVSGFQAAWARNSNVMINGAP